MPLQRGRGASASTPVISFRHLHFFFSPSTVCARRNALESIKFPRVNQPADRFIRIWELECVYLKEREEIGYEEEGC